MFQRLLEESREAKELQRVSLRDGDIWHGEGRGQRLQRAGALAACFLFLLMESVCVLYIAFRGGGWLQVAFLAGVFTHPVLVPLSICRA